MVLFWLSGFVCYFRRRLYVARSLKLSVGNNGDNSSSVILNHQKSFMNAEKGWIISKMRQSVFVCILNNRTFLGKS